MWEHGIEKVKNWTTKKRERWNNTYLWIYVTLEKDAIYTILFEENAEGLVFIHAQ